MDNVIKKSLYEVSCPKCGYVAYRQEGCSLQQALVKYNQFLIATDVCPNCHVRYVVEWDHSVLRNKYDAEHPYGDSTINS